MAGYGVRDLLQNNMGGVDVKGMQIGQERPWVADCWGQVVGTQGFIIPFSLNICDRRPP